MKSIKIIALIISINIQGYSQVNIKNQINRSYLNDSLRSINTKSPKSQQNNYNDSLQQLNCETIPIDAPICIKRADHYYSINKYQWAKCFYERAIKIDSGSALAYLGLARIARVNNDSITYRIMFNKAKSINPNDSEIIYEEIHFWDYTKKEVIKGKNR